MPKDEKDQDIVDLKSFLQTPGTEHKIESPDVRPIQNIMEAHPHFFGYLIAGIIDDSIFLYALKLIDLKEEALIHYKKQGGECKKALGSTLKHFQTYYQVQFGIKKADGFNCSEVLKKLLQKPECVQFLELFKKCFTHETSLILIKALSITIEKTISLTNIGSVLTNPRYFHFFAEAFILHRSYNTSGRKLNALGYTANLVAFIGEILSIIFTNASVKFDFRQEDIISDIKVHWEGLTTNYEAHFEFLQHEKYQRFFIFFTENLADIETLAQNWKQESETILALILGSLVSTPREQKMVTKFVASLAAKSLSQTLAPREEKLLAPPTGPVLVAAPVPIAAPTAAPSTVTTATTSSGTVVPAVTLPHAELRAS